MPWQAADPGTIAQDAQGAYHINQGGQWLPAPAGSIAKDAQGTFHVNSDALAPTTPGGFTMAPEVKMPGAGQQPDEGHSPVQDVIDMIRAAPSGVVPALKGILSSLNPVETTAKLATAVHSLIQNPQSTLDAVKNATPEQVGKNVLAPALVGSGLNEAGGALAGAGEGAAATEAATPAGQLGLRSTEGRPIAATAAGPTAKPTLAAQNQTAAEAILGADAGVPHGTDITPETLEKARKAPGTVLDEGAASLPTAPLSDAARQQVLNARGPATITKPTPNVATQINDIEQSLTAPGAQFSGDQIRATRNSLSSDATAGMSSADADTRAIARYKRNIVSALDQHVEDTMPANSAISPQMIANARATLAKTYTLQDLIGKGGDIDLQGLAKLHRDNPNLFTGNTKVVADFANEHPEVTGGITNADRISPPSLATDLAHVNILNPRTYVQPLIGAAGRASLRGGNPLRLAQGAPVTGAAGEFEHQPFALGPPPGAAFEAHQPGLATGAPTQPDFFGTGANHFPPPEPMGAPPAATGRPGEIDLMDFLSHGVEQKPAEGLSAGPMGAPAQEGIPFTRNAAHEAGDLTTQDLLDALNPENTSDVAGVRSARVPDKTIGTARELPKESPTPGSGALDLPTRPGLSDDELSLAHEPTLKDLMDDLRDYAKVKSQGVPEDIMARAPSPLVNRGGSDNASIKAASPEAMNRGTTNVVEIDPDGRASPVLKDVSQIDAKAKPGHLLVNGDTGEIIDRGGLPYGQAQGLRNRWQALHTPGKFSHPPLGDEFNF